MRAERGVSSRLVAGVLIALLHVLLVLALLRSAQAPDARHEEREVDDIAFAFIAAPKPQVPVEKSTPPPVVAPSVRPRPAAVVAREVASQPASMTIVQEPAPDTEAQPAPAPAPERRLDMDSLRAAARRVDSERTPAATGGRRESEQLRSMDDTALARGVQRAKRPDCQTKYSGGTSLNLLALIPLAIETVTDKGCKW